MLRDDDEIDAEAVGDTQDRPEILRVGNAVEDENELRRRTRENVLEIGIRCFRDIGDDSVVYAASGKVIDLLSPERAHGHACLLRLSNRALQFSAMLAGHADVVNALGMRADR